MLLIFVVEAAIARSVTDGHILQGKLGGLMHLAVVIHHQYQPFPVSAEPCRCRFFAFCKFEGFILDEGKTLLSPDKKPELKIEFIF